MLSEALDVLLHQRVCEFQDMCWDSSPHSTPIKVFFLSFKQSELYARRRKTLQKATMSQAQAQKLNARKNTDI